MSTKRVHQAVNSIWHLSKNKPWPDCILFRSIILKPCHDSNNFQSTIREQPSKSFEVLTKIGVLTFSGSTSLQTAVAIFQRLAAHTGRRLGRPPAPLLQRRHAVTKPTEGRDVLGAGAIERSWGVTQKWCQIHNYTYPTIRPWAYITCLRWISWMWQYCAIDCHVFWIKILSSTSNTTSHIDTHAKKKHSKSISFSLAKDNAYTDVRNMSTCAKQVSAAQLHMGPLSLQAICEGDISHPNTSCKNSELDQHTASHITQLHQITLPFPKVGPLLEPQKITPALIFLLRSWASAVWIQRIGLQGLLFFLKQKASCQAYWWKKSSISW